MQQQAESSVMGLEQIVNKVDGAVRQPTVEAITSSLKDCLSQLARDGALCLPTEICAPCSKHYARRLVHRSETLGYVMVAMVWGPNQGTSLHDHSGTWCVEGVVEGLIEVTRYELLERDGERCRFERRDTVSAGVGSAGSLIPPFDHHTIRNASEDAVAVTLHIYGEEMESCSVFEPERAQQHSAGTLWYGQQTRSLSYDH